MAYNRKTLAEVESKTMWLPLKEVKKKNGEMKEVFQSSVDLGGGKMLKISIDARLYTIDKEGKVLFPVYVSKWKSTAQSTQSTQKKSW